MDFTLLRFTGTVEGTFGVLALSDSLALPVAEITHSIPVTPDTPAWYTAELPWRYNQQSVSRIPEGVYSAIWNKSPKFGWGYLLEDVEGRTHIRIHAGNWAGNADEGLLSDSYGCILLGCKMSAARGQAAVLQSKRAIKQFHKFTKGESITLRIRAAGG